MLATATCDHDSFRKRTYHIGLVCVREVESLHEDDWMHRSSQSHEVRQDVSGMDQDLFHYRPWIHACGPRVAVKGEMRKLDMGRVREREKR